MKRKGIVCLAGCIIINKIERKLNVSQLYDPLLMPQDLRKAHKANDKAVLDAYGLKASASDNEIMAKLFKMYQNLVQNKD